MKRTLALLIALVMALALVPAISFAEGAGEINPDHDPVNFALTNVDFTNVTATADGGSGVPSTSSKKFFTINLSEYSGLFAAEWMIDYPEEFVGITAESSTWSAGIIAQINNSWDDEEAWSDKFASVVNIEYVGGNGGEPRGVEGNIYIRGGNYLMSGTYGGVQMGGAFHRFAYVLNVTPTTNDVLQDANGYYLPVDLTVTEFEYMIYVSGSPKASGNCADPDNTQWFVNDYTNPSYSPFLSDTDGKIYVTPVQGEEPPAMVTENFYVDGELWQTVEHEEGADWDMPVYTPAEGYTFTGFEEVEPHEWYGYTEEIPPVMVTEYFYVDGELYTTVEHEEGAEWAMPEYTPAEGYTFSGFEEAEEHMWYGTTEQIMVNVTIVYQYQDGDVIDTVVYTVPYGTEYNYESPMIQDYIAEPQAVTGTATEDITVFVNYAPVPYYHVVIHFVDIYDLNDEIYPAIEGTYPNGYVINFEYPVIEGYTYESQGLPGTHTVTGDVEVYVKYNPNEYPLTIIYQYEDGTQAAEPYYGMYLYKRDYTVESPVIEGYTADYPVVNGTMVIDGETIYVTYYANEYTITVHLVDEDGQPVGEDIVITVNYGEDYEVELPDIDGYVTPDNPTGVCEGDDEITVVYVEAYEPVPPTVAATKAEIRARATEDGLKDLRFIFTVNFNDSYVTYKGNNYGPTELYYKIIEFYSILMNEAGKTSKVKGDNIYTMYEDAEGEANANVFTYTAVLKGIKEANFAKVITATPYITYTMGGVTVTVDGPAIEASVNTASN